MSPSRWIVLVCLALFLPACQKQEESPPPSGPPPGVEIEKPTPAEKADQSYMTPQEGSKQGMQSLEVVDKNIALATKEPSTVNVSAAPGPEKVVFETKMGNVTFAHIAHGERLQCTPCHGEGTPSKIVLDQDSAHKLCRGCHTQQGAGPTKCPDCHKK